MILEDNKIIAEFDGYTFDELGYYTNPEDILDVRHLRSFNYESSWDLLMPVLKKIGSIDDSERFNSMRKYFKENWDYEVSIFSEKKDVHKALVNFIKWYNNKQNVSFDLCFVDCDVSYIYIKFDSIRWGKEKVVKEDKVLPKQIFAVSNDKIKDGDPIVYDGNYFDYAELHPDYPDLVQLKEKGVDVDISLCKKAIATTDDSLSLPLIPESIGERNVLMYTEVHKTEVNIEFDDDGLITKMY